MSELIERIKEESTKTKEAQLETLKIKEDVEELHKQAKTMVKDAEKWTREAMAIIQGSIDTMADISTNFMPEAQENEVVEPEKISYRMIIIASSASALVSAILVSFLLN